MPQLCWPGPGAGAGARLGRAGRLPLMQLVSSQVPTPLHPPCPVCKRGVFALDGRSCLAERSLGAGGLQREVKQGGRIPEAPPPPSPSCTVLPVVCVLQEPVTSMSLPVTRSGHGGDLEEMTRFWGGGRGKVSPLPCRGRGHGCGRARMLSNS